MNSDLDRSSRKSEDPSNSRISHREHYPWATSLAGMHEFVWQRLVRGVADRRSPARHPTLATVSANGLPSARTVVLRAATPATHCLEFHTAVGSEKVAHLEHQPIAAVHIWDVTPRLQVRGVGRVSMARGDDVAAVWERIPEASRRAYSAGPVPGSPIDGPDAWLAEPDPTALVVLTLSLDRLDVLHLGEPHRRAVFERGSGWVGTWVVP